MPIHTIPPDLDAMAGAHWCALHWGPLVEPIKAGKANGIAATVFLAQGFLHIDEIAAQLGPAPGPQTINKVTLENGPVCCFVGERALAYVYVLASMSGPDPVDRPDLTNTLG